MTIINTFSMAFSKTIYLFHYQTEICFFFFIFFILTIFGPRKKCKFLRTFPMELKYPENIKEVINGIYYRFS